MSQLTITLDDNLIQFLRHQAHQRGQELDSWVADLLAEAARPVAEPVAPALVYPSVSTVQKLYGSLKAPADFDYKKELEDGLAEKYGV
ncbi:MAG TPA: DUF6364 family protein [Hymenobacter sp.]|uniref:DUF6364 family protein n=1 Tax=Hymenobacter sp. TaxID=1898978 RepID=UPI002D7E9DD3|nr:DUF6364 family protein [Hymenobacter sp.]HET9503157.1 DUF6364 family protein [Hymenobacter sp.]